MNSTKKQKQNRVRPHQPPQKTQPLQNLYWNEHEKKKTFKTGVQGHPQVYEFSLGYMRLYLNKENKYVSNENAADMPKLTENRYSNI